MNPHFILVIAAFTLFISACSNGGGVSGGVAVPAPTPAPVNPTVTTSDISGEFTYEFSVTGCSTGRQKFNSKQAYCDGLLNDPINKSCARDLRVEAYNRLCAGPQVTQVGVLPDMSTARCVVNGMDLRDRTFLENLNPFNPQRHQSFRDMFWDGKKQRAFNVMFSSNDAYGRARFEMTPANSPYPALGEIRVQQKKSQDLFSVRSGLGTQIRMAIRNYDTEREVEVACRSDKIFRLSLVDLRQVKCTLKKVESDAVVLEKLISWDLQQPAVQEMHRGRGKESLIVRLLPANSGKDERIEVEAVESGVDRILVAESTLNEGIEVRHQGKIAGLGFTLSCAPASK